MSKLKKFGIIVLSIPLLAGLVYSSWCVWENYQTGDWSESCGTIFTSPHYRECKQRRVWIPRVDLDALARKYGGVLADEVGPWTKYADRKRSTIWVVVNPFLEVGGTMDGNPSALSHKITNHPCVPGSFLWHETFQWVCVKVETRPEGLWDDSVVPPGPRCWNEKGTPVSCS
jgi:hypothetical protein